MRRAHLVLQICSFCIPALIDHVVYLFQVVSVAQAVRDPSFVVCYLALVLLDLQQVALRIGASQHHRDMLLGGSVSLSALRGGVGGVVALRRPSIPQALRRAKIWMRTLREVDLAAIDAPEELLLRLALERLNPKQNRIEYNACSPIISGRTRVLLVVAELWRHERRRAAERPQLLMRILGLRRESKVYYLGRLVLALVVHKYVLQLDVSM